MKRFIRFFIAGIFLCALFIFFGCEKSPIVAPETSGQQPQVTSPTQRDECGRTIDTPQPLMKAMAVTVASAGNLISNWDLEISAGSTPQDWFTGRWGTNTTTFSYPVSGHNYPTKAKGAKVEITAYTSGDAKWWPKEVPVVGGQKYLFSDWTRSSVDTWVTVQFRYSNGSLSWLDIGHPSAWQDWKQFSAEFEVLSGVVSLTIFHLIKKVGWLVVDDYSLTEVSPGDPTKFSEGLIVFCFDDGWLSQYQQALPILNNEWEKGSFYIITNRFRDGSGNTAYMSKDEVLALQSQGHEVGAHTRNHVDLTTLPLRSQVEDEVLGSKQDLLDWGITSVTTFAYPFGAYSSATDDVVRSGFSGARTSDGGVTQRNDYKFLLERHPLDVSVSWPQTQGRIDAAKANNWCQIFVSHQFNTTGQPYTTPPAQLQQAIDYCQSIGIEIVTLREVVAMMP